MRRKLMLLTLLLPVLSVAFSKPAPAAAPCTCFYCGLHGNVQCWDDSGEGWPCWLYVQNFC